MSGPVSPPLAVEESDGSVVVRPTNTIKFNAADFTVAGSGSTATISIDSTGTGAALTATQVGFGDSSNLLTGSANFTFVDESGGTGPTVTLTGDKPILIMQDDTGATDFFSEFTQSGASLELRSKDSTGASVEIFRTRADSITFNDDGVNMDFTIKSDSTDFFFIDASENKLTLTGDADNDAVLEIIGSDTPAAEGPRLQITNDSGTDSAIDLTVDNFAVGYLRGGTPGGTMRNVMQFGQMSSNSYTVDFNNGQLPANFRIRSDNEQDMFFLDGTNEVIGIGGTPASGGGRLQVFSTTPDDETVRLVVDSTIAQKDLYGPILDLVRTYSDGVGQDGGESGRIRFRMENDNSDTITFCDIMSETYDVSAGSEDGVLSFRIVTQGTALEYMRLTARDAGSPDQKAVVINETSQDIGFRVEGDGLNPVLMVDSGQDAVGVGTDPDSGVERLHVLGTGTSKMVMIESTDASSSSAPDLVLYRNSGTPAISDDIGQIQFFGNDDGGVDSEVEYGKIFVSISDETASTEDSNMNFKVMRGGTLRNNFRIRSTEVVVNEDSTDVNFRVESDSNSEMFRVDAGANRVFVGAPGDAGGATLQVKDNTISHYCNVNTIRSDAVSLMVMVNEDNQGQMWVHDSSSAHTIQLVEGGVKGMHFQFMSTDGNITIDPQGSDTLNGGTASLTRSTDFEIYDVFCYANGKWALSNPA